MRKACRGCARESLVEILNLGELPLAGAFLSDAKLIPTEKKYPLRIHICEGCGLVQILEAVDPEILFQDYSFSSSTIKPLVDHFERYASWLIEKLHPRKVVEFGCNDGLLVDFLQKSGVEVIGVDVSRNITDIARKKGLPVMSGYFNLSMAEAIRDKIGHVDVVTGSNVFAHNEKPELILEAAQHLLSPSGFLCLEVMYAGALWEMLQWDTLYHEHLTFYSLSSLRELLRRFGFEIVDAERIPIHGGSLRICATQNSLARSSTEVDDILGYERERSLTHVATWKEFADRSLRTIDVVSSVFYELSQKWSIWSYGAAGKATMWLNACKMDYLGAVVDDSPLRAGKLMPGTHTPIVFPEQFRKTPPDCMFATAWNYADLIRSKESWFRGFWSVPLPQLRFF